MLLSDETYITTRDARGPLVVLRSDVDRFGPVIRSAHTMKSRLALAVEVLFGPQVHSVPDEGPTLGRGWTAMDGGEPEQPNRILSIVASAPAAACKSLYSVDSSLGTRLLPGLLSLIAGSVDVIGFLGLGGLFTAHITGNLVVLAAHIVTGRATPLAPVLAVPVFIAVLSLTRLVAGRLEDLRRATLRPLLTLQLVLLASFLVVGVAEGPFRTPNAPIAVVAGMFGVAAMAVQNALVQISLVGAPATAVMTTDITKFMMDLGAILLRRDPNAVASASRRAMRTWPAILGFTVGCGLGAVLEAAIGPWSLALPTALGVVALALNFGSLRCAHMSADRLTERARIATPSTD